MSQALKKLLSEFLVSSEADVLTRFAALPKAYVGKGDAFVYVPGSRPDRLLLVAHADTVRGDSKEDFDVLWIGDVVVVKDGPYTNDLRRGNTSYHWYSAALGADDRAGCAMLWNLWDGTHSVLITTGEESGLKGAQRASQEVGEELKRHQFAVEIDRRGDRQVVFYDVATKEFKTHILELLTAHDFEKVQWVERQGSCSDISRICESVRICGANLAAGYWNEHSSEEMLMLGAWMHTRTALKRVLKLANHQAFKLPAKKHWPALLPGFVGSDQRLVIPAGELSKRQRKKLSRKLRTMVEKGKITREEGTHFLSKILDQVGNRAVITEEQRLAHWLGDTWVGQKPKCVHKRSIGEPCVFCPNGIANEDARVRCLQCQEVLGATHGITCPRRVEHVYVWRSDTVENPKPNPLLLPSATTTKVGDGAERRCTHDVPLSQQCNACDAGLGPTSSPLGSRTGAHSGRVILEKEVNREITMCQHACMVCKAPWHHFKARSGWCEVPTYESLCPDHSAVVRAKVESMERECNIATDPNPNDKGGEDEEEQEELVLGNREDGISFLAGLGGGITEALKEAFGMGDFNRDKDS